MDDSAVDVTAVCEIGPAAIRRLCCPADETVRVADPALAQAALDGGDEPVVLLGDHPVARDEVWRAVLEPLLCATESTLLVHPSWWPASRIDAVCAIARPLTIGIVTASRARLLEAVAGPAPVVEIGPQLIVVTLSSGTPPSMHARTAAPRDVVESVASEVVRATGGVPVWLDAPAGVPGAGALAILIDDLLRAAGRTTHRVTDHDVRSAAAIVRTDRTQPVESVESIGRPRRRLVAAAVTVAGVVVIGIGVITRSDVSPTNLETTALETTALVEGRVTMEIPSHWAVQRIRSGPGSARVEVVSPMGGEAGLHLTQTSVPDDSLAAAATMLRRAIDAEPAGVFVDFHPSDQRAGRPAITYREIRPGHDIRWTVILDGDMRIGIGCQSATGPEPAEPDITAACDQAIRSAHEIG